MNRQPRLLRTALLCAAVLASAVGARAQTASAEVVGQKATVGTGVAATITSQRFEDWSLRCASPNVAGGRDTSQCEVAQVAQVKRGEQLVTVLTLAIAKTPAASGGSATELSLTALVPLNVFLPAGLGLEAGGHPITQLAYRNCNASGCWAQQKLEPAMAAAFQKSAAGTARLRLMNGQTVTVGFSLKGITAALKQLGEIPAAH